MSSRPWSMLLTRTRSSFLGLVLGGGSGREKAEGGEQGPGGGAAGNGRNNPAVERPELPPKEFPARAQRRAGQAIEASHLPTLRFGPLIRSRSLSPFGRRSSGRGCHDRFRDCILKDIATSVRRHRRRPDHGLVGGALRKGGTGAEQQRGGSIMGGRDAAAPPPRAAPGADGENAPEPRIQSGGDRARFRSTMLGDHPFPPHSLPPQAPGPDHTVPTDEVPWSITPPGMSFHVRVDTIVLESLYNSM